MVYKIFLLLTVSFAVNAGEMSHADKIIQEDFVLLNHKMQQCLSLTDKAVIQHFSDKGLTLNKNIESLCRKNERNAAQNHAVGFALAIQKSKDLSILKQCTKIVSQDSTTIMQLMKKYFVSNLRYTHICDNEKS